MHLLMLYGSAEPYQVDGWGITDGSKYIKSEDPYYQGGVVPKDFITAPLLGHVRAASLDTEISKNAAHPYWFAIGSGESPGANFWFGVHNGNFDEVSRFGVKGPNTDSYRAFSALSALLRRDGIKKDGIYDALSHGLFAEWMSYYREGSSIAIALHVGDSIIFFRNVYKPLYVSFGDDMQLVHTSLNAIEGTIKYARRYLDMQFSDPELLPSHSLISMGEREMMRAASYIHAPATKKRKIKHGK